METVTTFCETQRKGFLENHTRGRPLDEQNRHSRTSDIFYVFYPWQCPAKFSDFEDFHVLGLIVTNNLTVDLGQGSTTALKRQEFQTTRGIHDDN